eukprot:CAMPEP_0177188554 /NCGR_PEP_ID=MMETSP0367-20130122/19790_1 /TAXON_ID=447022 ORGANISM="Scrippsiella hangoei-like, Strain SHHI-4" /NCGR_SAMPLE_ID=MMETSP0367 /ASSEMBLY_ACC=CAM_ASM_000362 /LENGTH=69 /DNA_ID=CAMNT_0018636019 /DNA_START=30 /DNA_END=239 /DNA_ORIENTATION=+
MTALAAVSNTTDTPHGVRQTKKGRPMAILWPKSNPGYGFRALYASMNNGERTASFSPDNSTCRRRTSNI